MIPFFFVLYALPDALDFDPARAIRGQPQSPAVFEPTAGSSVPPLPNADVKVVKEENNGSSDSGDSKDSKNEGSGSTWYIIVGPVCGAGVLSLGGYYLLRRRKIRNGDKSSVFTFSSKDTSSVDSKSTRSVSSFGGPHGTSSRKNSDNSSYKFKNNGSYVTDYGTVDENKEPAANTMFSVTPAKFNATDHQIDFSPIDENSIISTPTPMSSVSRSYKRMSDERSVISIASSKFSESHKNSQMTLQSVPYSTNSVYTGASTISGFGSSKNNSLCSSRQAFSITPPGSHDSYSIYESTVGSLHSDSNSIQNNSEGERVQVLLNSFYASTLATASRQGSMLSRNAFSISPPSSKGDSIYGSEGTMEGSVENPLNSSRKISLNTVTTPSTQHGDSLRIDSVCSSNKAFSVQPISPKLQ